MKNYIQTIFLENNLRYKWLNACESGFTNKVYITDKFVVKIYNDIKRYQKEVWFYTNSKFDFTSKLIAHNAGEIFYIILERIDGSSLYHVWHTFNDDKKERIIEKISKAIRDIHTLNVYLYLQVFKEDFDWGSYVYKRIINEAKTLFNSNRITENLYNHITDFVKSHIGVLKDIPYVISYTDLHFDNILIDSNDDIYLIDYESLRYVPIDYVLDIWVRMSRYPHLFANENDEKNVVKADYVDIVKYLKKYYCDLFYLRDHCQRLKLYSLEYDLFMLKDYPNNASLMRRILEDIT